MVLVLVNAPVGGVAAKIARVLVEEDLAACVTSHPVTSTYKWDDKLHIEAEITLTIKTTKSALDALRARVYSLHPYETPELLVIPIDVNSSSASYVEWVFSSVKQGNKEQ